MRKDVIRVGDRVKIINPKFIERIGYKLHFQDLVPEVLEDNICKNVCNALALEYRQPYVSERVERAVAEGIAKAHVYLRGFGGKERIIHYVQHDNSHAKDMILDVYDKKVRMTGTYYPAYSSSEDYEPAGLENRQTHIILSTVYGDIEAINVEKINEIA